ncbi:MAG: PKD domain-containing protein, partial [Flavobacteriales bacterium]|nr:PKD domain-containing protein [Flavobacteriales bacterium]
MYTKLTLSIFLAFTFLFVNAQHNTPTVSPTPQQLQIAGFKIHSSKQVQSTSGPANVPILATGNHYCKSHTLTNKFLQENGLEGAYQHFRSQVMQQAINYTSAKALRGPIPIIFHIVHNTSNPSENVAYSVIQSYVDILNEDFQLQNLDAVTTHTTANSFTAANVELSFCLALQDPLGAALLEPGVERVVTTEGWYNSSAGEENKMKQASTGGADPWPRADYLNVWICNITNGAGSGTAGYAYLPSNFIPTWWDGIVLDYQLSQPSGRTLTHEVGHFLGLNHTWEGTGSGTCGDDDGLSDTPYTAGSFFNYSFGCPSSISTCGSIETQYENFMDYSNCYAMFSQDQANLMNATLNSTVAERSSLLLSDKCNASGPPVCAASSSISTLTAGGSVNFFDNSSGIPDTWSWNFGGGGTPTTSTTQNPTGIVFSTPGTYTVTLTASNPFGNCTTTLTIVVIASTGCDTISNIADTSTITVYGATAGYLSGVNNFGDIQKAEKYTGYAPWTYVNGAQVGLFDVQDGGNGATFDLVIYSDAAGLPGTEIDRVSFDWLSIETALGGPASQGVINLLFSNPVNVAGADFYIGVDFSSFGAGDTMGVFQNLATVGSNTAYEQWSDLTWHDMETAWGTGNTFSLYIHPFMTDQPVGAVASASTTTVCSGQPIAFDGSSSTNATGYNWYFTGGAPATGTNVTESVTYATPGTYTAYLVADGSCSGQSIDSVVVIITSGPTVVTSGTDPTCAGNDGTITVTATGGSGAYEYSIDGGTTFQPSGTFTTLTANTYNVVVNDLSTGCTSTTSQTLNAAPGGLTVTTVETQESCAGGDGTITITVTGGSGSYEYSIDGGATFQLGNTFSTVTAGTYAVMVNDLSNSCGGNTSSTVTASGSLTVSATGTDPTCAGGDGIITVVATGGSGSYEYSIDGGSTFFPSGSFTGQNSGTYSVVVNDLSGSCTGTSSVTLNSTSGITTNATFTDPACNGDCNGSITVTATGGSGTLTYTLDGGISQSTGNFSGICSGVHSVVVSDGGGCNESLSVTLTNPTVVTHTSSVTGSACGGASGSIVITATGGTGTYTYYV